MTRQEAEQGSASSGRFRVQADATFACILVADPARSVARRRSHGSSFNTTNTVEFIVSFFDDLWQVDPAGPRLRSGFVSAWGREIAARDDSEIAMAKLDLIDRKILTELMNDASLSVAAIADRVGLTQTPCWKRIQRLEAEGVLTRRVAIVDPAQVGLELTAFVEVEAADHSEAWRSEFLDATAEMPEIMEVHRMAGDVDYLLRVVVTDMSAFDQFYQRLTRRVYMKSVTSRFTMETIRASTVYPLMADLPANGRVPAGR